MTDLCAPFTVVEHAGISYIARDGVRIRPATPELVHLMNGGGLENGIHYELMPWCEVWSFSGDWYDDPKRILSLIGALKLRVERLEKERNEEDEGSQER